MNKCLNCDKETRNKKFCSSSCSATSTNKGRVRSLESRQKVSQSIRSKPIKNQFGEWEPKETRISGPYTRVYKCICKFSRVTFFHTTPLRIHPKLARSKNEYRYSCRFQFNVYNYPEWFKEGVELISKFGWYSTPGSRRGVLNIKGVSRDHLYSITDGYKNKIDPGIISHPANCELVLHTDNSRKNSRSSISLDELLKRIGEFKVASGEGLEPPL